MKKVLSFILVCILIALFSFTAFASKDVLLIDEADVIPDSMEEELNEKLLKASEKLNYDLVFLTVDYAGSDIQAFADDYYDYNGFGRGSQYDGGIIVVSMEDRSVWFSGCGSKNSKFTESKISNLIDDITPYLSDGDYKGAVNSYIKSVKNVLSPTKKIAISSIIGLIIAAISALLVKKSYSPVRFKSNAADYLDDGSFAVKESYDRFLYNNVVRVKIQSESSSGGGGSHTSSSGRSHVGGGGHF